MRIQNFHLLIPTFHFFQINLENKLKIFLEKLISIFPRVVLVREFCPKRARVPNRILILLLVSFQLLARIVRDDFNPFFLHARGVDRRVRWSQNRRRNFFLFFCALLCLFLRRRRRANPQHRDSLRISSPAAAASKYCRRRRRCGEHHRHRLTVCVLK